MTIRIELTVSMSSIILENQKSQATCTIWVREESTSVRFEQSSTENLKANLYIIKKTVTLQTAHELNEFYP